MAIQLSNIQMNVSVGAAESGNSVVSEHLLPLLDQDNERKSQVPGKEIEQSND